VTFPFLFLPCPLPRRRATRAPALLFNHADEGWRRLSAGVVLLSCQPTALDVRMLSSMGFTAVVDLTALENALVSQQQPCRSVDARGLVERSGLVHCRVPEAIVDEVAMAAGLRRPTLTDDVCQRILAHIGLLVSRHGRLVVHAASDPTAGARPHALADIFAQVQDLGRAAPKDGVSSAAWSPNNVTSLSTPTQLSLPVLHLDAPV